MSQKILIKRSSSPGAPPSTTDLDLGELAINTYDGKLYLKKDTGVEEVIEVGSSQQSADLAIQTVGTVSKDLTGFVNRTDSSLSFVTGTRTLTLTPDTTSTVYFKGSDFSISSPLSIVISNTPGGRYIKFNTSTQQLEELGIGANPDFKEDLLVSYIYWDGTQAVIFGDERHGADRDTQWHLSQHLDVGAVWRTGGDITYVTDDDTQTSLGFTDISIADEDIVFNIVHSATPSNPYEQVIASNAELPVLYLNGTTYTQSSPAAVPWLAGASRAQYNSITGGVGSLVQAASGKLICYWVVATNDSVNPIKLVAGQVEHSNENAAVKEEFSNYGLPLPELVPMYKIILNVDDANTGNSAKVSINSVYELFGRQSSALKSFDTIGTSTDYITTATFTDGTLTLSGEGDAGASVSLDGRYYLATNPNNYISKIPVADPEVDYIVNVWCGPTLPGTGYDYEFATLEETVEWLNENANNVGAAFNPNLNSTSRTRIVITLEEEHAFTPNPSQLRVEGIKTQLQFNSGTGTASPLSMTSINSTTLQFFNCDHVRFDGNLFVYSLELRSGTNCYLIGNDTLYSFALYLYDQSYLSAKWASVNAPYFTLENQSFAAFWGGDLYCGIVENYMPTLSTMLIEVARNSQVLGRRIYIDYDNGSGGTIANVFMRSTDNSIINISQQLVITNNPANPTTLITVDNGGTVYLPATVTTTTPITSDFWLDRTYSPTSSHAFGEYNKLNASSSGVFQVDVAEPDYEIRTGLSIGGNRVLTTADEGPGNGLDADTLDGQQGSYYLDYNNFSNTPTIPTDTNTTYSISAVDSGANAIIRLTAGGSGSGNDDITLVAGSNVTITPSGDNITISSTDTNTTYSSGVGLLLTGTTFKANLIDETLRSVTANSITTTANRTYAVMPDADGDLVVNVPWVDTNTDTNTTDWRVANSAGTQQFAVSAAEQVRFAGSGATSVSFDAGTQTITISSTDTNTNTTYSSGVGLLLTGTTFKANLIDETLRSVTANSITTTANRTYAVMPDADGDLVVNVPWVDTNTDTNTTDWRVANSAGTQQFAVSAAEQVRFAGSGATSVSFDAGTQTITISSTDTNTDTNTTYSTNTAYGTAMSGTEIRLNGGELPGSVDLDTYRTTGIYPQNANADASSGSNYPVATAGILQVLDDAWGNGLHTSQTYRRYNTPDVYFRNYYNGSWSSWTTNIGSHNISTYAGIVNNSGTPALGTDVTAAEVRSLIGAQVAGSYLTSYTETDTLATVTGRGASTATSCTFSNDSTYFGRYLRHDTNINTYLDLAVGTNVARMMASSTEAMRWGVGYTLLPDNTTLRLGTDSDFRMYHDGTNTYFRNYNHAGGNMYWQGEDTSGVNHGLIYMYCNNVAPYVALFYDGGTRLTTTSAGITVTGSVTANGATFTDSGGDILFPGGSKIDGSGTLQGDFYARRDNGTRGVYYFVDGGDKYLYWDGSRYNFGGSHTVYTGGPINCASSLRVRRENTSTEGGQIQLSRASDDDVSWNIDVVGSTADTSLRLFHNTSTARMLELAGYAGTSNSLLAIAHGANATIQCGSDGEGAIAVTLNDGYGNANIAFNHNRGIPDRTGSSARITSPVDGATGALTFQVTSSTTQNVAVALTEVFKLIPGTASATGALTATGNITAYSSDERLKENIKPIENALEKLHNISGVTFDWKDECEELGFVPAHKKNDAGVIAQRVQEVLPQAVAPAPFDVEYDMDVPGKSYSKSGEDYLTVQYEKLTPLLIEAVKEQQTIIDSQQAQIDELRQMIMEMKNGTS